MEYLKIVLCLTFVLAVSSNPLEGTPRLDHNVVDCEGDQSTNTLALRRTVEEQGKLLQVIKETFRFPQYSNSKNIITCIKVIDLMDDGKGGYPIILDGGVDFQYVLLQFTSQRNRGYKFSIEIYTKP